MISTQRSSEIVKMAIKRKHLEGIGLKEFNVRVKKRLSDLIKKEDYYYKFDNGKKIYRIGFITCHDYFDAKGNFYDVKQIKDTGNPDKDLKYTQSGERLPYKKGFNTFLPLFT